MDLFILPSLWGEAFPNVLGEAMSTSLPCIVSNVGDSAHILGNCGLIIEKNNFPLSLILIIFEYFDTYFGIHCDTFQLYLTTKTY